MIICDRGNRRIVQWSLENQQDKQIIIENIACRGLTMNENGDLFVSDCKKHVVKRWRKGEKGQGTIVAGGNGCGGKLNQLNWPTFIFVDQHDTIYVSDEGNNRVMKWLKDASQGIVVAGGGDHRNNLFGLHSPQGLIVNEDGDVYVVDSGHNRIMCWSVGSKEGRIIYGKHGYEEGSALLDCPFDLSFDVNNNLYIADCWNNRIQRIDVDND